MGIETGEFQHFLVFFGGNGNGLDEGVKGSLEYVVRPYEGVLHMVIVLNSLPLSSIPNPTPKQRDIETDGKKTATMNTRTHAHTG